MKMEVTGSFNLNVNQTEPKPEWLDQIYHMFVVLSFQICPIKGAYLQAEGWLNRYVLCEIFFEMHMKTVCISESD